MSDNMNEQCPPMIPGGTLLGRETDRRMRNVIDHWENPPKSTGSMQDDILQHRVNVAQDHCLSGSSAEAKIEWARQEYKTATLALGEARTHLEKMEEALSDAREAVTQAEFRCNTTRKAYLIASLES